MSHGIVRTDLLSGTDVRSELVSVRYTSSGEMCDIDNGNVVLIDSLEDGSRTKYIGLTPQKNSPLADIALIVTPETIYDESVFSLGKYYNKAGDICRGYRLHEHDIFSVTIDALDASSNPKVGDFVELGDSTKLCVKSEQTEGSTQVGTIIDINVLGIMAFYVIEVCGKSGGGGDDPSRDVVGTAIVGTSKVGG